MTQTWISVTERMPDARGRYLILTEEGYVWLQDFPTSGHKFPTAKNWHDELFDSGAVIAWAPFEEPEGEFSPLLRKWEESRRA